MGSKRLPVARVAGIVAWTTASVAWGTAAVAMSAQPPATDTPAEMPQTPPPTTVAAQVQLPALPSMPESGLVVLRYSPVERARPKVVVRTVQAPAASPSAPASAAAQPAAPAPAPPPPVTEQSSGS